MPPLPSEPSKASTHPRWKQLTAGAGMLVAGRIVVAVCGLIQVPIVLAHLGAEGFGVWLALTGLLWTASILDFGIGFALQNRIGTHLAAGREREAAALIRSAVRWLALGGLIVAIIGVPLAHIGSWASWLNVADASLQAQMPRAVAIVFVAAGAMLPLAFAAKVAAALQLMWITGLWTAIGSLLGLAAIAVAGWLRLPLLGFLIAGCILPLAPHVGAWLHLQRRARWLADAPNSTPDWSGLGRESALFFMPQLGSAFIGNFVPTLVAVFAGPTATAAFGVLQRLFGFALQLHTLVLAPAWPAYTRAAAIGDAAFVRRAFRATWLVTALAFIVPTLLLTPLVPLALRLWLGEHAPAIAPTLLWIMAGWHVLQFCGQPIAMVLNGVGRIQSLAIIGWVGIAAALALCNWLGPRWGAAGVVVALATPYLLLNLPITGWQAQRALAELRPRNEARA